MKIVKNLIGAVAAAGRQYREAHPPLCDAAQEGHYDRARKLLDEGADVHVESTERRWTPLHWAVHANDRKIVGLLLERGANPNAADTTGVTALHLAAEIGSQELVKSLLDAG